MTTEEKAAHDALIKQIKEQIEESIKFKANATEVAELKIKLAELEAKAKDTKESSDTEALKTAVAELEASVKALKEGAIVKNAKGKSLREQIKEQMIANPEKWAAFIKGEAKGFGMELVFKAPATMTVATNTGGSAYLPEVEMVPGFTDLSRNRAFLEQYSNSSSTARSRIVWVEKTNPEGQAEFIGEGELKPLIDFEWKTNRSDAKKVADKIKISTEMLDDIDFMAAAIENELRYQVDIAVDEGLLSGDGTGDNLKGITEYAGAYVLTTVQTTTPNNSDAILASSTQVKTLNFMATHAFVNPIDYANMLLQKSTTGEYVIPPFAAADGLTIGGVKIIESNQILVGSVLVGDMTKFVVRNYKPFGIQYGWVNDDFEKNLVTVIGERRLHDYVADNNTGAFVYDTFANIKTAITV